MHVHLEQCAPRVETDVQKQVIHAVEQARPDVAERRQYWQLMQAGIDPNRLVFLDEFGATTKMTRTHGRAPQGTRLVEKVPHGHWKSNTFVAGLRSMGLVAPWAIDGAMNGDLFVGYISQQLAPLLSAGDIVILDMRSQSGSNTRVDEGRWGSGSPNAMRSHLVVILFPGVG